MAVKRGLWVSPDAGTDQCRVAEVAMDAADDDADALDVTIIAVCDRPAVFVWMGSGLCEFHRSQLKPERGVALN
jgi:hypothetical protein